MRTIEEREKEKEKEGRGEEVVIVRGVEIR
jgi:hypothetical protein